MELVILSMVIIFILLFFLYNKEINYIKKNEREEEKEDNICAPTDFNPANGAPMIGCLDIYGNPYGVSGAEDNHNDLSHNNTSDDNITPLTNNLKSQLAYCTFGCLKKLATF